MLSSWLCAHRDVTNLSHKYNFPLCPSEKAESLRKHTENRTRILEDVTGRKCSLEIHYRMTHLEIGNRSSREIVTSVEGNETQKVMALVSFSILLSKFRVCALLSNYVLPKLKFNGLYPFDNRIQ